MLDFLQFFQSPPYRMMSVKNFFSCFVFLRLVHHSSYLESMGMFSEYLAFTLVHMKWSLYVMNQISDCQLFNLHGPLKII